MENTHDQIDELSKQVEQLRKAAAAVIDRLAQVSMRHGQECPCCYGEMEP